MAKTTKPTSRGKAKGTKSGPTAKIPSAKAAAKTADPRTTGPAAQPTTVPADKSVVANEGAEKLEKPVATDKPEIQAKTDSVPGPEKATTSTTKPVETKKTDFSSARDATKTQADSEPAASFQKPATLTRPPKKSRSIFSPLVLGGLVAGGIGFLVAELDLMGDDGNAELLRLQSQLEAQSKQITALEQAPAPTIPEVDLSPIDDLRETVTALGPTLDALDTRLTEVEKQPISGGSTDAAVAAYERELQAIQESVAAQRAEIERLLENALDIEAANDKTAQATAAQAALTKMRSAIDGGQPFADDLAALTEAAEISAPEPLARHAQNGVPTLSSLQRDFPEAARAALSAARAYGDNESEQGVGGFLRRQLGARSVAPREGNDPDAILSRAELAVREGRLSDALAETDALPEAAKSAIGDWTAGAHARHSAQIAADQLADQLTAN